MPTQETKSPSKTRNPKPAVPAYRQRAGYSQAIVTLTDAETRQRRDYWLGEFDQPESRERYHRVIAEWERRGRRLPPPDFDAPPARRADEITIVEVIREYWRWAADYYRPKHVQALEGALVAWPKPRSSIAPTARRWTLARSSPGRSGTIRMSCPRSSMP